MEVLKRYNLVQWVFILAFSVGVARWVGIFLLLNVPSLTHPFIAACMGAVFFWATCAHGLVPNPTRFAAPVSSYRFGHILLWLMSSIIGGGMLLWIVDRLFVPEGTIPASGLILGLFVAGFMVASHVFRRLFASCDWGPHANHSSSRH